MQVMSIAFISAGSSPASRWADSLPAREPSNIPIVPYFGRGAEQPKVGLGGPDWLRERQRW
jgi:hypothetical protein